jgi:hypothetical protein
VYVFATAALIGLILIGPKFAKRQAIIEFKSEGRQRAAMNLAGRELPAPQAAKTTRIQLWPLVLVMVLLVTAASWRLYHRRRSTVDPADKQTRTE